MNNGTKRADLHIRRAVTLLCAVFLAGPSTAETLTCKTTEAWRLETGGLTAQKADFYGFPQTSDLRADMDAGTFSAGGAVIDGMQLRSKPDPATGADLIYSMDDGSIVFRARLLDDGTPFLLIDTYVIYYGTCER